MNEGLTIGRRADLNAGAWEANRRAAAQQVAAAVAGPAVMVQEVIESQRQPEVK